MTICEYIILAYYKMPDIYKIPSIYAHIVSGALLIAAVAIFVYNFSSMMRLEPYKRITIILLFSIVVGIHGLSHMGIEAEYNIYNPITLLASIAEFL